MSKRSIAVFPCEKSRIIPEIKRRSGRWPKLKLPISGFSGEKKPANSFESAVDWRTRNEGGAFASAVDGKRRLREILLCGSMKKTSRGGGGCVDRDKVETQTSPSFPSSLTVLSWKRWLLENLGIALGYWAFSPCRFGPMPRWVFSVAGWTWDCMRAQPGQSLFPEESLSQTA